MCSTMLACSTNLVFSLRTMWGTTFLTFLFSILGFPGITGAVGVSGLTGTSGSPGAKGEPGSLGMTGPHGRGGISGMSGRTGAAGISGQTGRPMTLFCLLFQSCFVFVLFCFVSFFGKEDFRYLRLPLYVSNY